MNCSSCGGRNPRSLQNCAHCGAFIGGKSYGDRFSGAPSGSSDHAGGPLPGGFQPGFQRSSSPAVKEVSFRQIAPLLVLSLLVFGAFFAYPELQKARGKVENYILVWCVTQSPGVTTPAELEAQGFKSAPHRARMRHQRDRDRDRHSSSFSRENYFCYEKDYGPNKPEHGAMKKRSEYREIHRYFTDP